MGFLRRVTSIYKNLSIKKKILLILYIQIVIPIALIIFMSYSADIIYNKSIMYSQDILKTIELRLNDYTNNIRLLSQDLLYEEKIYDILNGMLYKSSGLKGESEAENKGDRLEDYEKRREISNNILKRKIFARSEIQSICIYANNGDCFAADNSNEKISIADAVRGSFDKIHTMARSAGGKGVWYMAEKGNGIDNVFYARILYNRDNYKEIGIMIILVRKEFLETIYKDILTQDMQNLAILTKDNKSIVSKNPKNSYLFDKGLQENLKGEKGLLIDNQGQNLISYISMDDPPWRVVSYISLKQLFKDIDMLRQWMIILSIISFLIISIIGLYVSVDFIDPINRLVKGMEKVRKGEALEDAKVDRKDELGYLNRSFNEMAKEINYLVNGIYREQITSREAQIKALQSQINPHFLFNTLESINWMAQLNNVSEISETVSDLSSIMEASIGRDDKLITIQEEFSYIDSYISILKRRYEERITFQKNVDDGVLKVKIPRLLIQPLIENAVYHGVENKAKGKISLHAYLVSGCVHIEVLDDGSGIEAEELEALNDKLSIDNDTYFRNMGSRNRNQSNKSIGIENVNRRIKLFYGDEYGVRIESESGKYTLAKVAIPYKSECSE